MDCLDPPLDDMPTGTWVVDLHVTIEVKSKGSPIYFHT